MPEWLMRMSIRPKRAIAASTAEASADRSRTSAPTPNAPSPIDAATARTPSVSRSIATTRAPSWAKKCAAASPIPAAAPVITATFPSSRAISIVRWRFGWVFFELVVRQWFRGVELDRSICPELAVHAEFDLILDEQLALAHPHFGAQREHMFGIADFHIVVIQLRGRLLHRKSGR